MAFSRTTWVSWHEEGIKPFWILMKQEMRDGSQAVASAGPCVDRLQLCTSVQTANHASASSLSVYSLMPNWQCQALKAVR